MRTIAVINQKGGCGKTTLAINLAAVLAAMGRRTLLVDMDPQSHCALGLAVPEAQLDHSIGDMLRAGMDGSLAFSDVVWQISRSLDLAPSTMALAGIEQELSTAIDKDRRLAQVLAPVDDQYEFCIVDCPPSIGLLTFNALRASQEVIIPVETGYFSLQGAVRQEATIEMLARRAGHNVRFMVLATMYDVRTKLAREILAELKRHFADKLLPVVINFNAKLKEAASFGQPITEYDSSSRGMQDFDKLAAWLLANPPAPAVVELAEGETPVVAAAAPAMSRAAELVERARALAARTAALSTKLSGDSDIVRERLADPPAPAPGVLQPQAGAAPAANLAEKLARVYGARATSQGLLFVQPAPTASCVYVAGDFNGWSDTATPLKRDERLGVWQTCIPVPPGRYRYRLVIDGRWTQDPFNKYVEVNPFGELNNVVEFGDEA
ncbi:MAG: AAA family ATPase [Planctomycetota bacterium]|nr:AAA family ATPase [Planctomycetota bacterium]